MDAFNQAYEGITGVNSLTNANSSNGCQMFNGKVPTKGRVQDMNLLFKISSLLNKNNSDVACYQMQDEDMVEDRDGTDASDVEISGDQGYLHARGSEAPMSDKDTSSVVFKTDSDGSVQLTKEERETFVSEGLPLPNRIPLTKAEERALKRIRRKIKNKLSAQESRRKKKEYVEGLEKRVEVCNSENSILQQKVDSLESTVRALLIELNRLRKVSLEKESRQTSQRKSIGTQTGTCLKCHMKREAIHREHSLTRRLHQKTLREQTSRYMERYNGSRIESLD